jgi:hypothetical protein
MKSTLTAYDKLSTKDFDNKIPNYAIALIFVSSIVLILVFIYYLNYKSTKIPIYKNGMRRYSGPIREVWSNPDTYNTNYIVFGIKGKV